MAEVVKDADLLAKTTMKAGSFQYVGDNLNSVYANHVNMIVSQWDMTLNFGEILGEGDDQRPVILHKVKVTMSKELVKVLSLLLNSKLEEFEQANGEIKVPEVKIQTSLNNPAKGKKRA